MPDRVNIYIDGSNLYHGLRDVAGRTSLDFGRFATKLVGERRLIRAYYYNAPIDQDRDPDTYRSQQKFFQALRATDYFEVRLGRLVYLDSWPATPPHEKGIDIKIAIDMLTHGQGHIYDVAILVSGDTDFADAIYAVKELGRHVEVALFPSSASERLREAADHTITIDHAFLSGCWR